jgi:hypothetical protein
MFIRLFEEAIFGIRSSLFGLIKIISLGETFGCPCLFAVASQHKTMS